jgi:hypothetical protein
MAYRVNNTNFCYEEAYSCYMRNLPTLGPNLLQLMYYLLTNMTIAVA